MDKERKRALKNAARNAERRTQLELLPSTPEKMKSLFDRLDQDLGRVPCAHDHALTRAWCQSNGLDENKVISWAASNGGYCDCEVLANVEEVLNEALKA